MRNNSDRSIEESQMLSLGHTLCSTSDNSVRSIGESGYALVVSDSSFNAGEFCLINLRKSKSLVELESSLNDREFFMIN